MASAILATILLVGIATAQVVLVLHFMPSCIVVCDTHACDASTLDENGRQQEGCVVYESGPDGTHTYTIEPKEKVPEGKCNVPIAHGLRCLVRI